MCRWFVMRAVHFTDSNIRHPLFARRIHGSTVVFTFSTRLIDIIITTETVCETYKIETPTSNRRAKKTQDGWTNIKTDEKRIRIIFKSHIFDAEADDAMSEETKLDCHCNADGTPDLNFEKATASAPRSAAEATLAERCKKYPRYIPDPQVNTSTLYQTVNLPERFERSCTWC